MTKKIKKAKKFTGKLIFKKKNIQIFATKHGKKDAYATIYVFADHKGFPENIANLFIGHFLNR